MELVLKIVRFVTSVGTGILGFIFGDFNYMLIALTGMVIIDYIMGILAAKATDGINSQKGFIGIARKLAIFVVIAVAFLIQNLFNNTVPLREIVISFYLFNEIFSIIENIGKLGVPIPEKLIESFEQLKPFQITRKNDDDKENGGK